MKVEKLNEKVLHLQGAVAALTAQVKTMQAAHAELTLALRQSVEGLAAVRRESANGIAICEVKITGMLAMAQGQDAEQAIEHARRRWALLHPELYQAELWGLQPASGRLGATRPSDATSA